MRDAPRKRVSPRDGVSEFESPALRQSKKSSSPIGMPKDLGFAAPGQPMNARGGQVGVTSSGGENPTTLGIGRLFGVPYDSP